MKSLRIAALLALVASTFSLSTMAAATETHQADFAYSLGSLAEGAIVGECRAMATLFSPGNGSFTFDSNGGVLEHYTTVFNYTTIDPQNEEGTRVPLGVNQSQHDQSLSPGRGVVSWEEGGKNRIFGNGWPYETDAARLRFAANYTAQSLRTGPPSVVDAGDFLVKDGDAVKLDLNGVRGTNAVVDLATGSINITGDLSIYLEAAHIQGPDGFSFQAPPYWENVTNYETDLVGYYQVRLHHIVLRLNEARIQLSASQADLACQGGSGRIEGSILAYGARGHVQAANETVEFDRQELLIQGSLDYEESVHQTENNSPGSPVAFIGQGQFTTVGIDFANTGIVAGPIPWADVGFWTLLIAGAATAAAYLAKTFWPLYTRLEKPVLLDHVTRTHVVEALRTNPWMNVADLQKSTGLGRSTVRYQLAVLARHGLVKERRTTWGSRFAVRMDGIALPSPPVDPIVTILRREAGTSPVRLSILMRLVQSERSLSRMGTWKAIQRCVREGSVTLERREGGVWLRCQPDS